MSWFGTEITSEDVSSGYVTGPLHEATDERLAIARRLWVEVDASEYEWTAKRAVHRETGERLRRTSEFPFAGPPEQSFISHFAVVGGGMLVFMHAEGATNPHDTSVTTSLYTIGREVDVR